MTNLVPKDEAVVNIPLAIVLTLLTCGIYNLFWIAKQMRVLNGFLNTEEYSFWKWFFLALITCGIYHIIHEYAKGNRIKELQEKAGEKVNNDLPVVSLLLTFFGLSIVSDALIQEQINTFYENNITFRS